MERRCGYKGEFGLMRENVRRTDGSRRIVSISRTEKAEPRRVLLQAHYEVTTVYAGILRAYLDLVWRLGASVMRARIDVPARGCAVSVNGGDSLNAFFLFEGTSVGDVLTLHGSASFGDLSHARPATRTFRHAAADVGTDIDVPSFAQSVEVLEDNAGTNPNTRIRFLDGTTPGTRLAEAFINDGEVSVPNGAEKFEIPAQTGVLHSVWRLSL